MSKAYLIRCIGSIDLTVAVIPDKNKDNIVNVINKYIDDNWFVRSDEVVLRATDDWETINVEIDGCMDTDFFEITEVELVGFGA